jgi:hypothetical protein
MRSSARRTIENTAAARPQRAVVVECRDALGRRHEFGTAFGGRRFDEIDDGFFCRPSFHERTWIALRGRRSTQNRKRACDKANE